MGLLDFIDPTRDWPVVPGPAPDFNLALAQLESMRFGDPLDAARFLGQPDQIEWRSRIRKDFEAVYTPKGLRLGFKAGRLSQVTYVVGGWSTEPGFAPARPKAPNGTPLTPALDRKAIVALFGEPDPGGSDQTCLQVFHGGSVISDFYLDDTGHLKEWVLYPDD